MPVGTDRLWVLIATAGLVFAPFVRAEAADRVSEYRSSTSGRPFIAVMGAVRQAGVYEMPSASPALWEIVQRSGGLSEGARGAVRIIRNGRVAVHTHVATGMRTMLRTGDVVVISGTPGTSNRDTVEVAIVGLLDRPVVLRLRPEHADLPQLVDQLGQSEAARAAVRVVGSAGGRNRGTAILRHSVLVFDPRSSRPDKTPPLPKPVLLQPQPSRRRSAPRVAVAPRTRNSRDVGSRDVRPASTENDTDAPNSQLRVLRTLPPADSEATGAFMQVGPKGAAPARIHEEGDPSFQQPGLRGLLQMPRREATEPAGSRTSAPAMNAPANPSQIAAAPDGRGGDADLIAKADADEHTDAQSQASIDPLTMIVGIFAAMGVLSAVAMLWSMSRRAMRGTVDAAPADSKRVRLQRLLDDELEICEAPLVLPISLEFFGAPGGMQQLRADGAATFDPPHFAVADAVVGGSVPPLSQPGRRSDQAQATPPQPASVAAATRSDVLHGEVR
ncbi:MAG: hypothetical protein ACE5KM_01865 [Planctomycetaceae bacterium]